MIAIIDYDAGNIKSVEKALLLLGQEVVITGGREEILKADKVILPGVGAFGDAMANLRKTGLDQVIREVTGRGTPFLGICLGLQLLFERSGEAPGVEGLGILKGEILRIPDSEGLKIPHMGWNSLHLENDGRLFRGIQHAYPCVGREGQCVRLPVPPGEEQRCGHSDTEKFCGAAGLGTGGLLLCLRRESFPAWT